MSSSNRRIPELTLERYLADALDAKTRRQVDVLLAEYPEDAVRLAELRASSETFLQSHPPEVLVFHHARSKSEQSVSRYTPAALLGRALIVLLFLFVLAAFVTHGVNLAIVMSRLQGNPLETDKLIPGGGLHSGALFLVSAAAVILIRRRIVLHRSPRSLESAPPISFNPPADTEVASFLARFLPGLARHYLRMSPKTSPLVSRDNLFLPVSLLPPLARMAARYAGTSPAHEKLEPPLQEQAAYLTLAHEEFHQLCFDVHTDATFRAVCFVQLVALAPFFMLLLTAPLSGEFTAVLYALAPVWFPFVIWALLWGLHGGSHLLEHLADVHADQRIRPTAASRKLEAVGLTPDLDAGESVYIDSRSHHPGFNKRLAFLRTLESTTVVRIIFFQVIILFTLTAYEGIMEELAHQWSIPSIMAAIRVTSLITATVSALLFSAVVGALAPLRQAVVATGLTLLFLWGHHVLVSSPPLALDSPWMFLTLVPVLSQWSGRVFLRGPVTRWLGTGNAPAELPPRVEHLMTADESFRLALQSESSALQRQTRFQRLLGRARAHGMFFDAVFAMGLCLLLVITLADILPRLGFAGTLFFVGVEALVLAIYFTQWPERPFGIVTLWVVRMAGLGLGTLMGAIALNLYLYIQSQGTCVGDAAQQQLCIGQIMMDPERVMHAMEGAVAMVVQRCNDGHLLPESLTQDTASSLLVNLFVFRCAFYTPGNSVGPIFLAGVLISFFFDTGLSAFRWIAARRGRPS